MNVNETKYWTDGGTNPGVIFWNPGSNLSEDGL